MNSHFPNKDRPMYQQYRALKFACLLVCFMPPGCHGPSPASQVSTTAPRDQRPGERAVDLGRAPRGLRVSGRLIRLRNPITGMLDGQRRLVNQYVEFRVSASEPIPARALDPVLTIGPRVVTSYEYEDPRTLLFHEYEPEKLPNRQRV